jgi:hypothetical protein
VERAEKIRISERLGSEKEKMGRAERKGNRLISRKHSQDKQNGFTESVLEPTDHEKRGSLWRGKPGKTFGPRSNPASLARPQLLEESNCCSCMLIRNGDSALFCLLLFSNFPLLSDPCFVEAHLFANFPFDYPSDLKTVVSSLVALYLGFRLNLLFEFL